MLTDTPPPAAAPAVAAIPVAAPAAAPAAPAAPLWYSMLRFEALVDSYYQYNFTGKTTSPANTVPLRNFDVTSNTFTLNYAKVGMQLDVSPVTVRVDFGYGHTAAVINGGSGLASTVGPMAQTTGVAGSLYGSAFIVQQAYSSLALPGNLSIDFGKFVTTAGAEVNEANKNWMYSRSLLFFTIPILHTGVRANLKVNDMLSLQASVVNGINNDPDNNGWKTIGLSATIAPSAATSIIITDYFGKESPQGTMPSDMKNTLDVVISQTITDKFALNLNIDYIKLASLNTFGASLMGRFVVSEMLVLAARGEYVKDKNLSFALGDTSFYEGTVMAGIPFAGHLEVRGEVRADIAKDPIFVDAKKNQVTGTVAFIGFL